MTTQSTKRTIDQKVAPMWQVGDQLYHHSDEERANAKGDAQEVWVVMDVSYFIGTVQHADDFAQRIFTSEHEAAEFLS